MARAREHRADRREGREAHVHAAIAGFMMVAAVLYGLHILHGSISPSTEPTVTEVPTCDPYTGGPEAAAQLRARMAAGVTLTDCDLRQFDDAVYLGVVQWEERDRDARDCEHELVECYHGWWDAEDCRDYQEASRLTEAIGILYEIERIQLNGNR